MKIEGEKWATICTKRTVTVPHTMTMDQLNQGYAR